MTNWYVSYLDPVISSKNTFFPLSSQVYKQAHSTSLLPIVLWSFLIREKIKVKKIHVHQKKKKQYLKLHEMHTNTHPRKHQRCISPNVSCSSHTNTHTHTCKHHGWAASLIGPFQPSKQPFIHWARSNTFISCALNARLITAHILHRKGSNKLLMMMSWHGNIYYITGPLWRESPIGQ